MTCASSQRLPAEEAWAWPRAATTRHAWWRSRAILPDLPEPLRAGAVREVMTEYWKTAGHEALRIAVACAPWMALEDARACWSWSWSGRGASRARSSSAMAASPSCAVAAASRRARALMEAALAIVAVAPGSPERRVTSSRFLVGSANRAGVRASVPARRVPAQSPRKRLPPRRTPSEVKGGVRSRPWRSDRRLSPRRRLATSMTARSPLSLPASDTASACGAKPRRQPSHMMVRCSGITAAPR